MKQAETYSDLLKEFKAIRSIASEDTGWMAKALLYMIDNPPWPVKSIRAKRPPSEWQQFVGKGVKAGHSIQELAKEWRKISVKKDKP